MTETTPKLNRCWFSTTGPMVYHSGDLGDIIYSLLWCRSELGAIRLVLGPDHRWELRQQMNPEIFGFLAPLLRAQPWINSVEYSSAVPERCICLNDFRKTWFGRRISTNLFQAYAEHFQTGPLPEDFAWIKAEPITVIGKPIVISRSGRYRNGMFPWYQVSHKYRGRISFVGLRSEFDDWTKLYGSSATYRPVNNALELAGLISGSSLFIGNQSFPMSLALSMGVTTIQEVGHPNADCRFRRESVYYYEKGLLPLPEI